MDSIWTCWQISLSRKCSVQVSDLHAQRLFLDDFILFHHFLQRTEPQNCCVTMQLCSFKEKLTSFAYDRCTSKLNKSQHNIVLTINLNAAYNISSLSHSIFGLHAIRSFLFAICLSSYFDLMEYSKNKLVIQLCLPFMQQFINQNQEILNHFRWCRIARGLGHCFSYDSLIHRWSKNEDNDLGAVTSGSASYLIKK